jgi:hypothetical protein
LSILAAHYFQRPNVGPGVPISAGNVATGIGAALSAAELDELRERVERILRLSGRRAAVLIDGIDRVDRSGRTVPAARLTKSCVCEGQPRNCPKG